jgi:hypothetical protein
MKPKYSHSSLVLTFDLAEKKSQSLFLDFIHCLVSNKPKIIRPKTKTPKNQNTTHKTTNLDTHTHKLQNHA